MSRYDSSHEALDLLNKKHFGSLIERDSDLTYSTGQLGKIPRLYPQLLNSIRLLLSKPEEKFDPGISVIMRQLSTKTTPSTFVAFGKELKSGFMTIGSFSPRKKTHWAEIQQLIADLGQECDHLLEDFKLNLDEKWSNYQYDVTTRLVSEQATVVNTALRMHTTLEYGKSQKYVCNKSLLGYVDLDFTKAPLNISIKFLDPDIDAKYKKIVQEIKTVALNPIEYINDESIPIEDLDHIDAYIERFFDLLGNGKPFTEIQPTIDKITKTSNYQADFFKELLKRYYGVILTPIILKKYFDQLKAVIQEASTFTSSFDVKILDHYSDYLSEIWQRKYYLGLAQIDKNYKQQIVDSIYQELEKYALQSQMDSVQKNALNNAINNLDTKLSNKEVVLESPKLLIDVNVVDFHKYIIKDIVEPTLEQDDILKDHHEEIKQFSTYLESQIKEKLDKKLLTHKDYRKELEDFSKTLYTLMAEYLVEREQNIMERTYSALNTVYIKTASSMRYDSWLNEHNISSPNDFAKVVSNIFLENDLTALEQLLPETILTSDFNYENYYITLKLIQHNIANLKKGFKRNMKIVQNKLEQDGGVNFRWEFLAKNLKDYLTFWFKDFSGIVPEEILVRLSSGIILVIIEVFKHMRVYAAFLEKSEVTGAMDLGKFRELAQESINQGTIVSDLRGRV